MWIPSAWTEEAVAEGESRLFCGVKQAHQRVHIFFPALLTVGKIYTPEIFHSLLGLNAGLYFSSAQLPNPTGLIDTFPASDPVSAAQPKSSKYDLRERQKHNY